MKIYLGGPINGCTDAQCKDWRAAAKEALAGHTILDPMDRDYRGREDEAWEEIVEQDKLDIRGADILLMNCPTPSVGTSMEILYGWERGKRVMIVASGRVSPWLRAHGEIYLTLESAVKAIAAQCP